MIGYTKQCCTCLSYINIEDKMQDTSCDTQRKKQEEQRKDQLHKLYKSQDKINKRIKNENNKLALLKLNLSKMQTNFCIGRLSEGRILYEYVKCPVCSDKIYLR